VTDEPDVSRRRAALLAFAGVVVTLLGVGVAVACGTPPDLLAGGDVVAAEKTIAHAGALFRVGVLGWFVAIVGDVLRAWALYVFFRSVNRSLSMLAAWWMLLHDAVFGFSLVGLLLASDVVAGAPESATVLAMLGAHRYGFHLGLLFFSLHLLVVGWLALASREVPRVLGALLVVAFAGYFVDSASVVALASPPSVISRVVAIPNTIGELALMIWLALRGGRSRLPRSGGT
jgi:hypothetical protein